MDTGNITTNFKVRSASAQSLVVEVVVYLNLLVVVFLLDSGMNKEVCMVVVVVVVVVVVFLLDSGMNKEVCIIVMVVLSGLWHE